MNLKWLVSAAVALSSWQVHGATISGNITYSGTQTGKVVIKASQTLGANKILTLDGVDDFVRVDSLKDLSGDEITIGYWFRGNSIQSAVRQQSGGFIIAGWNNLHVVSNDGGTGGISVGSGYNDGNWHHLLFTWKRNTANGFASYLDGKPVASRNAGSSAIPNHNSPLYFGTLGGIAEFTDGKMDEITIFRRALTAAEIQQNWNKKYSGAEADVVGFWNFDDETANDLGPLKHEGFLAGGAFIQDEGVPGLGGGISRVELAAPGAFSISNMPDGEGYSVTAFLDVNGNGQQDGDEPFGSFAGNPFVLAGAKTGVDITLAGAPKIVAQPVGGRFAAGSTVKLNVTGEGVGTLTYTWLKNDLALTDGGRVSGSGTAELTLSNMTAEDTGVYSVVVSNLIGGVMSDAVAVLVVSGGATLSGQITYGGSQTGKLHLLVSKRKLGNRVLKLDGLGDTVATTVTDLSGSELTIQYWWKGPNPTSVVRQQAGGYIVSGWNGLTILSHDKGTSGISMGAAVTDGAWHHVIMTWKQGAPGGFASYLDGKLVTKRDAATSPIPNHNAQLYFGSLNNGGEFANGMVDEIGIWNRALTAAEVAANWSQPLVGSETGLYGYWDFNEGAATDRTANQNNGDLLGDAVILAQDIPILGSFYPLVVDSGLSFQLANIPTGPDYFITAFMDANGNGVQDASEPSGTFSQTPTTISGNRADLNFALTEAPRITFQPSPRRVGPGDLVQFFVGAVGTGPLAVQWFKDGITVNNGGRIAGANLSEFQISAIQGSDAGAYSVRVTNAQGEVISRSVDLVVVDGGFTISGEARFSGTLPGRIVVKTERFKPGNKALKLDGDGDYVRVAGITNLSGNEITIAFWFKGSSVQSAVRQQASGYIIAGWNGMQILSNDGGTGGILAGNGITDGNWHHIALTWKFGEPSGFASYLDGLPVAARDAAAEPLPNLNVPLYFGALSGSGEYANGQLDEIAIWNRALSAAEIGGVSKNILTGAEADLIGFWNFDAGNANDLSPHGFHGTLHGDAITVDAAVSGLGGGAYLDELTQAGPFAIGHLPGGVNYFVTAFVDENGDFNPNGEEAVISYGGNPFDLNANKAGVILDFNALDAPALAVAKVGSAIRISWPAEVQGFSLESAATLSPAEWSAVQGVVNNQIDVTPGGGARFFRLTKP